MTCSTCAVAGRALIVGSLEDEHVQAVMASVRAAEAPMVLDASTLEQREFVFDGDHLVLDVDDPVHELALSGAQGWVRRLSPPGWRTGTVGGSREAAVRNAWVALVVGIASHPGVAWLTPYERLIGAENKLRQAQHATGLGIRVPRTLVARRPEMIPAELGDELVVKPLGVGHFVQTDGQARVLWAQTLRREDPRLEALAGAPFLVQEQLQARRHLRIVTLQSRAWSCALEADGLPLDWRRSEEAHHAFKPTNHRAVEEAAVSLAQQLGLGYSSQDWIDTGKEMVFVDLNPAGQWLFLPEPVSGEVAQAIGLHLTGTGS
jgi:hypothetical protein